MGTYWEKVERMADIAEFVASFGFPAKAKDCRARRSSARPT